MHTTEGDCRGPVSKPSCFDIDLSNAHRRTALSHAAAVRGHRKDRGLYSMAAERQAAARDRRVLAEHDVDVCDGARGLGMGQRQGEPGPVGQFPASIGDAHAFLLRARGQSEQHQSDHCEYGRHPKVFSRHFDCLIAEPKVAPFRPCRQGRAAGATSIRTVLLSS